jgi:hypothetical protein
MSMETYQPIFDAVRSRISSCDIDSIVRERIPSLDAFGIEQAFRAAASDWYAMASRPFVLMRPTLTIDGNQWCALYGENLQEGVVGFGDSPEKAGLDFDRNYYANLNKAPTTTPQGGEGV